MSKYRQTDFPETQFVSREVLSGTERHRRHGEGTIVPKGTIVEKSHWWWNVASVAAMTLVGAFLFIPDFRYWVIQQIGNLIS